MGKGGGKGSVICGVKIFIGSIKITSAPSRRGKMEGRAQKIYIGGETLE